jgi:hypothetical protein
MNSCSNIGPCTAVFSLPMFRDLERQQTSFTESPDTGTSRQPLLQGAVHGGDALEVSGSYFPCSALTPARGRLLTPADDRAPGESTVAVLSHRYWTTRFNRDPNVINETLTINGKPFTIVGVAPEDLTDIDRLRAAGVRADHDGRPDAAGPQVDRQPARVLVYVFARLKPGVSIQSAAAAINQPYRSIINDVEAPLQKGMSAATLERFKAKVVELSPGHRGQSSVPRRSDDPAGAAARRHVHRVTERLREHREPAAGQGRRPHRRDGRAPLDRRGPPAAHQQLLGESIVLAGLGGVFGVLVAMATMKGVIAMMPADAGDAFVFCDGLARGRVPHGDHRRHGPAVRSLPCAACVAAEPPRSR